MNINQRVKEVRLALNMSQAKFAKALSVASGHIGNIELNRSKVPEKIVKLLFFVFNVNEEWLKTGEGTMFNEEPDLVLETATSAFKKLKPVYQDYIIKQIDQLLEIQDMENKEES